MSMLQSMKCHCIAATSTFRSSTCSNHVYLISRPFQSLARLSSQATKAQILESGRSARTKQTYLEHGCNCPARHHKQYGGRNKEVALRIPAGTAHLHTTSARKRQDGNKRTTSLKDESVPLQRSHSDSWKGLMRTVTKPVVIITTRQAGIEDDREALLGATVSSFNSVCMEPHLSISFNLKHDSRTFQVLKDTGFLCLTFPQNTEPGSRLAHLFASQDTKKGLDSSIMLVPMSSSSCTSDKPSAVAFAGLDDHHNSGIAFSVLCQYEAFIEVGDHVVVTARVLEDSIYTGLPHGWGVDAVYGDAFSQSHSTLAHIHGNYTCFEPGSDLFDPWKLDDKHQDHKGISISQTCQWYLDRLVALEDTQLYRAGALPAGHQTSNLHLRARDLSPTRLQQYERYYDMRLMSAEKLRKQSATDPEAIIPADDLDQKLNSREESRICRKMQFPLEVLLEDEMNLNRQLAITQSRIQQARQAILPSRQPLSDKEEDDIDSVEQDLLPRNLDPNLRLKIMESLFRGRLKLTEEARKRKVAEMEEQAANSKTKVAGIEAQTANLKASIAEMEEQPANLKAGVPKKLLQHSPSIVNSTENVWHLNSKIILARIRVYQMRMTECSIYLAARRTDSESNQSQSSHQSPISGQVQGWLTWYEDRLEALYRVIGERATKGGLLKQPDIPKADPNMPHPPDQPPDVTNANKKYHQVRATVEDAANLENVNNEEISQLIRYQLHKEMTTVQNEGKWTPMDSDSKK